MWIPEETVSDIREKVNIIDVISQYVQLNKKGKNHFGYCPFHEERTPSFSVNEEEQFFHCFSCKRGGTVFNFIMEIDGLTYPEAIVKVAEMAGIPIEDKIQGEMSGSREKTKTDFLIDIHEQARTFYHQVLTITEAGNSALNYLTDRGLTAETIELFQLGYSPPQKEALYDYLSNITEFDDELLKESGLFIERDGKLLDRFANRIIFPLKSAQGRTIAFSGRDFRSREQQEQFHSAKYLNSPETDIFNKSNVLFNMNLARPEIRHTNEVYLFEGYMDVISAYQAGIKNGIASMGTSLTSSQIHQLDKMVDHIVIAYDGDRAGNDAAKRAIDLLSSEENFELEIVQFPKDSDPDDYIRNKGVDAFHEIMTHGRRKPLGFLMSYYRHDINLQNESEQTSYIEKILKEMVHVTSAIEREYYFKELSEEFSFSIDTLKEQFQTYLSDYMNTDEQTKNEQTQTYKHTTNQPITVSHSPTTLKTTAVDRAENIILYRLMQFPRDVLSIIDQYDDFHFQGVTEQEIFILYVNYYENTEDSNVRDFLDLLETRTLTEKMSSILSMTMSKTFDESEIKECIDTINRQQLSDRLDEAKLLMKEASQTGDTNRQNELLVEIVSMSQKLEQR